MTFRIPPPELQIEFSLALAEIRRLYLQDALQETATALAIPAIDAELGRLVPGAALQRLAAHSMRGELVFPVPIVLRKNPYLLGYYRLLYGYSQKAFYTSTTGVGAFKAMEERGAIASARANQIEPLCVALIECGVALLEGIGTARLSASLLDDLALLTVGPQLRGGANVKVGAQAIVKVFEAIHAIVRAAAIETNDSRILVRNAAGRMVHIEFAPDPDIIIREEMQQALFSDKIAIEVKGGTDFSNVHNRIGEAEKSHQKARARGFVECWTVVNVDRIDIDMARRESPSTNRFYRLSDIVRGEGDDFDDFRRRILSLTGVA